MENRVLPRSIAITIVLEFIILFFFALLWLLGMEISIFLRDLPAVSDRISRLSPELQKWIGDSFGLNAADQESWILKLTSNLDKDITIFLKGVFTATISTVIMLVMIPIYAAL